MYAAKLQKRAARYGVSCQADAQQIARQAQAVQAAQSDPAAEEAVGELLFAAVALARQAGVDPNRLYSGAARPFAAKKHPVNLKAGFGLIRQPLLADKFTLEVQTNDEVELIAAVANEANLTKKDAEQAVNTTLNAITEALKNGDKVTLVGFGTFEVRERPARKGRNPQTGAEITIEASKLPAFKAGKALKDAVQ